MKTTMSPSKFSTPIVAAAVIFCMGGIGAATAQPMPNTENGHYSLSPVVDGVIRFATGHGPESTCNNNRQGLACYAAPDERLALDPGSGRLQAENEKLKAQLAEREPTITGKIDEPLPKTDSLKKPEPKVAEGAAKIQIPLPSDRDMDRMMSFLEQAWWRLVEMANRMQKDVTGKI